MPYTFPVTKDMVTASTSIRVSTKSSERICKILNKKNFKEAKDIIEKIFNKKRTVSGKKNDKYYTKTTGEILKFIKSLESNANDRGFMPDEMTLMISAHQGRKMLRGRRKRSFGLLLKSTYLHGILKKPTVKKKKLKVNKK